MNQNGPKARLIIVEEEVIIASDLENRLTGLGYEICGRAERGDQALELVEKHRPDLVLMDIVIKGEMNGIEAAEIIREKWGAPVIFLTAYHDSERLEQAKPSRPFGYVLKPFQDRDLKVTIEMALYASRVDAERRRAEEALARREDILNETGRLARVGGWEHDLTTGQAVWTRDAVRHHRNRPRRPHPRR